MESVQSVSDAYRNKKVDHVIDGMLKFIEDHYRFSQ